VQPDTIVPDLSNPQSLNRFSYVQNNPVRYSDPSGHYLVEDYGNGGCSISGYCSGSSGSTYVPAPTVPLPADGNSGGGGNGGDPATPWDVGVEWLTGEGPRHHDFREGDPFTELLQEHDHLDEVREEIAIRLNEGNYRPGSADYWLGGLDGTWKYIVDYSTLLTFGQTGNLAVTFLGSYDLNYYIVSVDPETGSAEVMINVENESTLASATHPPVIGYTDFWLETIAPMTNNLVQSGPMSRVTQSFWWTETIYYK